MELWPVKKHRIFDLSRRLRKLPTERRESIKIERLPRQKLKPVWWTFLILVLTVYMYIYLKAL